MSMDRELDNTHSGGVHVEWMHWQVGTNEWGQWYWRLRCSKEGTALKQLWLQIQINIQSTHLKWKCLVRYPPEVAASFLKKTSHWNLAPVDYRYIYQIKNKRTVTITWFLFCHSGNVQHNGDNEWTCRVPASYSISDAYSHRASPSLRRWIFHLCNQRTYHSPPSEHCTSADDYHFQQNIVVLCGRRSPSSSAGAINSTLIVLQLSIRVWLLCYS